MIPPPNQQNPSNIFFSCCSKKLETAITIDPLPKTSPLILSSQSSNTTESARRSAAAKTQTTYFANTQATTKATPSKEERITAQADHQTIKSLSLKIQIDQLASNRPKLQAISLSQSPSHRDQAKKKKAASQTPSTITMRRRTNTKSSPNEIAPTYFPLFFPAIRVQKKPELNKLVNSNEKLKRVIPIYGKRTILITTLLKQFPQSGRLLTAILVHSQTIENLAFLAVASCLCNEPFLTLLAGQIPSAFLLIGQIVKAELTTTGATTHYINQFDSAWKEATKKTQKTQNGSIALNSSALERLKQIIALGFSRRANRPLQTVFTFNNKALTSPSSQAKQREKTFPTDFITSLSLNLSHPKKNLFDGERLLQIGQQATETGHTRTLNLNVIYKATQKLLNRNTGTILNFSILEVENFPKSTKKFIKLPKKATMRQSIASLFPPELPKENYLQSPRQKNFD